MNHAPRSGLDEIFTWLCRMPAPVVAETVHEAANKMAIALSQMEQAQELAAEAGLASVADRLRLAIEGIGGIRPALMSFYSVFDTASPAKPFTPEEAQASLNALLLKRLWRIGAELTVSIQGDEPAARLRPATLWVYAWISALADPGVAGLTARLSGKVAVRIEPSRIEADLDLGFRSCDPAPALARCRALEPLLRSAAAGTGLTVDCALGEAQGADRKVESRIRVT